LKFGTPKYLTLITSTKSTPQSASAEDILSLQEELSRLNTQLKCANPWRDTGHSNPIQQYIDVSSVIIGREEKMVTGAQVSHH